MSETAMPADARLENLRELAAGRTGTDPAHDFQHVLRVEANARRISLAEGADLAITVPAALLHELFNYPKDHPESHRSGDVCADQAAEVMAELGFGPEQVAAVAYAIRVHGFSRGVVPDTLEAKVLQDADRLDAIGAIGIARCFATCTAMGRPFYEPVDPFCRQRSPDDLLWGIDHFFRKLLRIPEVLHTDTARAMAEERVGFMQAFLAQLGREIGG